MPRSGRIASLFPGPTLTICGIALVLPGIPGYGFSGPTRDTGWNAGRVAKAWALLVRRLDYARYGAQGGDWGAVISPALGRIDPDHVVGIHVNASFSVLVSHHSTTLAQIKTNATTFLNDMGNRVGGITHSTLTSAGIHLIKAYATNEPVAKHNTQWYLIAFSDGKFTWYTEAAYSEGYPTTKQTLADLNAIMSSFQPT